MSSILAIMGDRPRAKPTAASIRRAAEIGHHDPAQVEAILQDTWGHLKPKAERIYTGFILWTHTVHREIVPIDWEFEDLPGSPWFAEHLSTFISEKNEDGREARRNLAFR